MKVKSDYIDVYDIDVRRQTNNSNSGLYASTILCKGKDPSRPTASGNTHSYRDTF